MQDIVIGRVFRAPVERIWQAWTDPELRKRWYAPKGFTSPISTVDFRVGGRVVNCMRSPDGKDYYSCGTYKEIVPLKRIVVTDSFADKDGNPVPASAYGLPADYPSQMLVTLTFEDAGDGMTKVTLRHAGVPEAVQGDTRNSWSEMFDKLTDTQK